jgi:hypothetical protein
VSIEITSILLCSMKGRDKLGSIDAVVQKLSLRLVALQAIVARYETPFLPFYRI